MNDAIKGANAARRFPKNTCPASRLVQQIGEALVQGEPFPLLTEEPDTCGESMLAVVTALFKARSEIEQQQAQIEGLNDLYRAACSMACDALEGAKVLRDVVQKKRTRAR